MMKKLLHFFLDNPLFRYLVSRSKKIILPGFDGVPLYDVVVFFIEEVKKEGLTERASAIAFNTFQRFLKDRKHRDNL